MRERKKLPASGGGGPSAPTEPPGRDAMVNPFPKRTQWQDLKKTNGIPDGLLPKGSVGEHLEDLRKRWERGAFEKVSVASAPQAKLVARDARALIVEVKKGGAAKKAKIKKYAAFEKIFDDIEANLKALDEKIVVATNPLKGGGPFYKKGRAKAEAAMADPGDSRKFETAYREGLRNDIGQRMRAGLKHANEDKTAYPANMRAALQQYDDLVEKWGSRIDQGETRDFLADDKQRAECFKDVTKALEIAKAVFKAAG